MNSLNKNKVAPWALGLLLGLAVSGSAAAAFAGSYYFSGNRSPNYYPVNPYFNTPVIIQERVPIIIERRGSNDYLYQYDNVYGSEASAAGRMSSTVVNPPPQLYILRGY
jgi:hypothetical protein